MILNDDEFNRLQNARVAVIGLGGVGSHAAEALVRCGVGTLLFVDNDLVDITNINRQLIALHSTIGMKKTDVMKNRALDINKNANIKTLDIYYDASTQHEIDLSCYNFVIDAIDTITSKLLLIKNCHESNTPVICCMGTGNKLDPTRLEITDIYETSVCPVARVIRRELKKIGIKKQDVLYSREEPVKVNINDDSSTRHTPGSMPFVPPAAGYALAAYVVAQLI